MVGHGRVNQDTHRLFRVDAGSKAERPRTVPQWKKRTFAWILGATRPQPQVTPIAFETSRTPGATAGSASSADFG